MATNNPNNNPNYPHPAEMLEAFAPDASDPDEEASSQDHVDG